jgi:hypothetical protein
MKLYSVHGITYNFNTFDHFEIVEHACHFCNSMHLRRRTFPAHLEYCHQFEGQFAYGSGGDLHAFAPIAEELASRFPGLTTHPVAILTGKSKFHGMAGKPARAWPYKGPDLLELYLEHWLDHDPEHSTLILRSDCSHCGHKSWGVDGMEHLAREGLVDGRWEMLPGKPRDPDKGLFIRARDLDGKVGFGTPAPIGASARKSSRNSSSVENGSVLDFARSGPSSRVPTDNYGYESVYERGKEANCKSSRKRLTMPPHEREVTSTCLRPQPIPHPAPLPQDSALSRTVPHLF